jgi:hypothetical protein
MRRGINSRNRRGQKYEAGGNYCGEVMIPADCTDYFTLADGTRVCSIRPHDSPHCFCENLVKNKECPKGCKVD